MKKTLIPLLLAAMLIPATAQIISPDRKLATVEKIIETFYVGDVDTAKVVEDGIRAMLKALDPHSSYSTPQETKELNEPLQGNFSGIGIQFQMISDTLYVIQTVAGGPAEQVGIVPGDRIISANDSMISGVKRTNPSVMKILRGPKGTEVDVKVKRAGTDEPINFSIIRDDIPIHSVDAAYMAAPGTGYIRVSRFAEDTPAEVAEAIGKLRKQGMTDLIIDLQDNGGGYLHSAYKLAEMFLNRGDLIVYTDGERVEPQQYYAMERALMPEGRVVVMVNQYSASASEILSGALQDNDRGVVVGRRTFGKGLVQRPFPFPDGSMVRLTVSRYHTPSGRCIQKPYTPGDNEDYSHDLINRYNSGEFSSADSIKFDPALKYKTLRNGRTVYGGGGIMPDRFVAIDTTQWSPYYRDLLAKGIYNRYAVNYVDRNRDKMKADFPEETDFIEGFEVTPEMIDELVAMGEEAGVKADADGLATSGALISRIVKGIVGRDLVDQSTYFRVVNPAEPVYRAALEIISDPELYDSLLRPGGEEVEP